MPDLQNPDEKHAALRRGLEAECGAEVADDVERWTFGVEREIRHLNSPELRNTARALAGFHLAEAMEEEPDA